MNAYTEYSSCFKINMPQSLEVIKSIEVVIALIVYQEHILISKRRKNQSFANLWEFSGGKYDPNLDDSLKLALQRELLEELNLSVSISEMILWDTFTHRYKSEGLFIRCHAFKLELLVCPDCLLEKKGAEGQLEPVPFTLKF